MSAKRAILNTFLILLLFVFFFFSQNMQYARCVCMDDGNILLLHVFRRTSTAPDHDFIQNASECLIPLSFHDWKQQHQNMFHPALHVNSPDPTDSSHGIIDNKNNSDYDRSPSIHRFLPSIHRLNSMSLWKEDWEAVNCFVVSNFLFVFCVCVVLLFLRYKLNPTCVSSTISPQTHPIIILLLQQQQQHAAPENISTFRWVGWSVLHSLCSQLYEITINKNNNYFPPLFLVRKS